MFIFERMVNSASYSAEKVFSEISNCPRNSRYKLTTTKKVSLSVGAKLFYVWTYAGYKKESCLESSVLLPRTDVWDNYSAVRENSKSFRYYAGSSWRSSELKIHFKQFWSRAGRKKNWISPIQKIFFRTSTLFSHETLLRRKIREQLETER